MRACILLSPNLAQDKFIETKFRPQPDVAAASFFGSFRADSKTETYLAWEPDYKWNARVERVRRVELFSTQRDHRIDAGGAARRNIAGDERHNQEQ